MAVVVTIDVNGFDYGFDFENQRIDIDAGVSVLSVIDLYTAIKDAQDDSYAMPYERIADASGLDQLSPGTLTFLTVSLRNNWEINTLKSGGNFTVGSGNLIRADGADPFLDNPLITYINNLSQAGVVVETGVSGLTPTESTALGRLTDIDNSLHHDDLMRLIAAALLGKSSGGPGSPVFRDLADNKDRITGTADSNGNRTAVSLDATP